MAEALVGEGRVSLWVLASAGVAPLPETLDEDNQLQSGYQVERLIVGKRRETASELRSRIAADLKPGSAVLVYDPRAELYWKLSKSAAAKDA